MLEANDEIDPATLEKIYFLNMLNLDLFRLRLLLKEANSIVHEESELLEPIDLYSKHEEEYFSTYFSEEDKQFIKKQSLNQLIVVAGISLIEKACKDWFKWGLINSSIRIYRYANKGIKEYDIKILDLIESENTKKTIIDKITSKINFLDVESCNNEFSKVYGFKIYDNQDTKYYFKKFINMRHAISHNSGVMDKEYVTKCGLPNEAIGNLIAIKEDGMEKFLDCTEKLISNMVNDITTKVNLDKKYKIST